MKYEIYILVEKKRTNLSKTKIHPERISFDTDVSKILEGPLFLECPLDSIQFCFGHTSSQRKKKRKTARIVRVIPSLCSMRQSINRFR